jgi:3-oxoacyl-[acyl-carrier-protein] synthase II
MTATRVRDQGGLALSAWSTVSPYGVGRQVFTAGIRAGRSALSAVDRETYPGPFERAGLVPDFSPAGHLGRKGTRTMDRATGIAVALVQQLLVEAGPDVAADSEEVGLVLGTGSGSVQSIMDFTRASLTAKKPYHVDPARFPNTVMNRAAGQSAIWHKIRGPNVTVAGGSATGLLALSYAARLLRGGHCRRVLSGAVEEFSVQRAWLEWHGRAAGTDPGPLAEGGALVLLEATDEARRAGRVPLASLLATRFMACQEPGQVRETLANCVTAALRSAGAAPADVGVVAPLGTGDEADDEAGGTAIDGGPEEQAISDALGGPAPHTVRCRALVGDASAASAAFQIVALLAAERPSTGTDADLGLVTTTDRDGVVGCALFRLATLDDPTTSTEGSGHAGQP